MSIRENENPFDHRRQFGETMSVRTLAEVLRTKKPHEVDEYVEEQVTDIDTARAMLSLILKYLVARGL